MATKDVAVNLIGEEEMSHTPVGRIVSWAVTYGRYIMIGTEIVVLLAFISRFSLDRKLTDLNDEIAQKQAIIEANADFEQQFRSMQSQVSAIKKLMSVSTPMVDTLDVLQAIMPGDVYLAGLNIADNKVSTEAIAGSSLGFASFISNLQNTKQFRNVELGDIKRGGGGGIQFSINAALAVAPASPSGKNR